jgi:hypothetical protein
MKKLNVTIQLEMSVPDDWELVGTSEGTPVLKLPNGVFMDVAIEPLFASTPRKPGAAPMTTMCSTTFWTWWRARR